MRSPLAMLGIALNVAAVTRIAQAQETRSGLNVRRLKGKRSNSSSGSTHADIFAPTGTSRSPADATNTHSPSPSPAPGGKRGGKRSSSSKGKGSAHVVKKPKSTTFSMSMKSSSSSRSPVASPVSKGKGKGKGGGGSSGNNGNAPSIAPNRSPSLMPVAPLGCDSMVARRLSTMVPQIITQNPAECCMRVGPTAVFVTHAQFDPSTNSEFEPFWDEMFQQIADLSRRTGTCFVMTGINQDFTPARSISDVLVDVITGASMIAEVPAIMSTDPTDGVTLINTIRTISSNPDLPSIGVFNIGYPNVIIEAIVTGLERLPYVGVLQDSDFGKQAGEAAVQLLNGMPARPLCFNARPDLESIGVRCATFYDEVTETAIVPETGINCNANTTVEAFVSQITNANANVILSHVDCCANVASAAEVLRRQGRVTIVGCTDADATVGNVNFVTTQPVQQQAYQASSWVNLPTLVAEGGENGRGQQFFPSLQSLVNTGVFNVVNS